MIDSTGQDSMPGAEDDLLLPPPDPAVSPATRPGSLQVSTRQVADAAVVTLTGELDLDHVPTVEDAVTTCLATDPTVLVIDLTGLAFLGTSGLGVLVRANAHAATPGRLRVVAADRVTLRPLQVTELDRVLALYPTLDDALAGTNALHAT